MDAFTEKRIIASFLDILNLMRYCIESMALSSAVLGMEQQSNSGPRSFLACDVPTRQILSSVSNVNP